MPASTVDSLNYASTTLAVVTLLLALVLLRKKTPRLLSRGVDPEDVNSAGGWSRTNKAELMRLGGRRASPTLVIIAAILLASQAIAAPPLDQARPHYEIERVEFPNGYQAVVVNLPLPWPYTLERTGEQFYVCCWGFEDPTFADMWQERGFPMVCDTGVFEYEKFMQFRQEQWRKEAEVEAAKRNR